LRFSRARYVYVCALCSSVIGRGQPYFRHEPHPWARMRGETRTRLLCLSCVLGDEVARDLGWKQLPLGFELTRNGLLRFPPRVEVVDVSPQVLRILAQAPERIRELSPERLEGLVGNRLTAMGFGVELVGSSTFQRDGGVDMVAWSQSSPLPFLMAVQVKHTTMPGQRVGPEPVRGLLGAVEMHGFHAGLLVTNTTFTADAIWAAQQRHHLVRLRDIEDLRRWLRDEFLQEYEWRELPAEIELCPGVVVRLPR